jgi:hypothetical protein
MHMSWNHGEHTESTWICIFSRFYLSESIYSFTNKLIVWFWHCDMSLLSAIWLFLPDHDFWWLGSSCHELLWICHSLWAPFPSLCPEHRYLCSATLLLTSYMIAWLLKWLLLANNLRLAAGAAIKWPLTFTFVFKIWTSHLRWMAAC